MAIYRQQRRVAFSETDMAGLVHFTQFFRYMEDAEHAWWRHLNRSVITQTAEQHIGWPRVAVACDFQKPLRFEEVFQIDLTIQRIGRQSIGYDFCLHGIEDPDQVIATGSMTVACVVSLAEGQIKAIEIPSELRRDIQAAQDKEGVVVLVDTFDSK